MAFQPQASVSQSMNPSEKCPTIGTTKEPAIVHWQQGGGEVEDGISGALRSNAEHSYQFLRHDTIVRRLTPMECERLQGFPDGYTLIPWKKGMATDGHRYKALGNSMAVPVIRWIGERIQLWEDLNN